MRTGKFKTKILFLCHVNLLLRYLSFVFYLNNNLLGSGQGGEERLSSTILIACLTFSCIFFSIFIHFILICLLLPEFSNCKKNRGINIKRKWKMEAVIRKEKKQTKSQSLSTSYPPTLYYLQCRTLNFKCNSPIPQHSKWDYIYHYNPQ